MSDHNRKSNLRRQSILSVLQSEGELTIPEIMARFSCSEATARRDLNLLAETGKIIRTIGGAHYERSDAAEVPFREKQGLLLTEKELVAARAAALVEEGDIVGLTGGTTTYLIAKQLKHRPRITIVTNAVNIAMELADSDHVQTVLTGGVLRSKSYELCGLLAESMMEKLRLDKMFVGIDGISMEQGLTTHSELEAQMGKTMIARAERTYAVFDHTKLGRASLFAMAPLEAVHGVITDRQLPPDWERELRKRGIETARGDTVPQRQ